MTVAFLLLQAAVLVAALWIGRLLHDVADAARSACNSARDAAFEAGVATALIPRLKQMRPEVKTVATPTPPLEPILTVTEHAAGHCRIVCVAPLPMGEHNATVRAGRHTEHRNFHAERFVTQVPLEGDVIVSVDGMELRP